MSREASEPIGSDPFGSTTGAAGYVARPACERALDELLAAVRREAPCIALVGPNGIGKTQLVRVLAERLAEETELLLLPYAALEFPDLCHWALGLLGEDQGPFSDPGGALLEAASRRASAGRRLILALDDASGLPIETARALSALVRQASGELQLLVIPVDDPRAGRVLAALGSEVALVRFNAPMSAEESAAYVRERLAASGAGPAIQDRFTEPVLAWLHRESGGLPRELHILSVQFLRDRPEADRDRFSRREQWLEIDTAEDEPETQPAAEAELLEAEDEEPPPPPKPPESPPPREARPAAPHIPLPPPSEEKGWLRSHLLLVAGLGLVALGIIFALRTDAPMETSAASIDVPVAQERVVQPAVEPVTEPAVEPVTEPPSDFVAEQSPEPMAERIAEPVVEEEVQEPAVPSAAAEAPAPVPAEATEPSQPVAVEEAADTPPVSPQPLPEPTPEVEEIAASEPEPPAPAPSSAPDQAPSEPATDTVSEPSRPQSSPEPKAAPPSAPRPLPVAATGPPVTIRVDANPPARVLVDGRDLGQTPIAEITLASGRHRFEVIFPDGTILLREKLIDDRRPEIRFNQLPRP